MPENKFNVDGFLNDAFSGTRPITSQDMRNLVISSMGTEQISFIENSRKLSYNDTLLFLKFSDAMNYVELPVSGISENGYPYSGKVFQIANTTGFTHAIRSSSDDSSKISFNGGFVTLLDSPPYSMTVLACDGTNWFVVSQRKLIENTDSVLGDIINRITLLEQAITNILAENFLNQASADARYVKKEDLHGKVSYYFEFTALSTLTLNHNLGFYPNATVVINGEAFEVDVTYIDINTVKIDMSVVTSGQLILS